MRPIEQRRDAAIERFERSVVWVASEIATLLDAGSRVALRTDEDLIDADAGVRHRARLLTYLALVEPSGAAPSPLRDGRLAEFA